MRFRTCFATVLVVALVAVGRAQDLPVMDGLALWLDATDASTVFDGSNPAEDDDFVNSWLDKSPNAYEAFVPGTAGEPVYKVDGINGLPAVSFAGEFADGMVIDGLDLQRPYTAFIANQYWGDVRGRTLQSQDINWLLGLWAGNFGHYAEGWVNAPQPTAEVNRPYVADAIGTETESFFHVNGVEWTISSAPTGIPGNLAIAGAGQFPGEVSDADVSEIIIYDRILSGEELTSVRTHLYDKYGTTPVALPPTDDFTVFQGEIGTFSATADLDFEGDFLYAINAGGPGENEFGEPLVIGDATFVEGSLAAQDDLDAAGAKINRENEAPMWYGDPDYGDTPEADNLEWIMRSIRWNVPPGVTIDLDVEEGASYKLQMLFAEEAWDRGFDIFMEDEEVVQDFTIHESQGGMANRQVGVHYTREFVASDDELNILLGGSVARPDNNPLVQAITLERIEDLVSLVGDCNGDGVEDAADLACVTTLEARDAVLTALNTLPGDLDGNGDVAFADFLVMSANFGSTSSAYNEGNIDLVDGVAFADFLTLSANFGQTPAAAAIPEPSALALSGWLVMLACALRRRRRR